MKLTGGAGFRYEDNVAARFLVDLLGGKNSLGAEFGRVSRIDWQARDAGWLADDLEICCRLEGIHERSIGLSIKSDRQVTEAGFPGDFVVLAGRSGLATESLCQFREGKDAIGLVTGRLANNVKAAWSTTLREALETSPERMVCAANCTATG